jgi:hypothetical protein
MIKYIIVSHHKTKDLYVCIILNYFVYLYISLHNKELVLHIKFDWLESIFTLQNTWLFNI